MANEADIVAVELLARVEGFDGKVRQSASSFGGEMKRIEQSAATAERSVSRSMDITSRSLRQAQQATRNLGFQISDIGTQLSAGASPFLVLAQQGPQVANALDGAKGAVGRFAAFLSGPWGAALLAAGSILGVLISKSINFGDKTDDLVEKLKEQAQKARDSEQANELFGRTLEGVRKAADDAEKAIAALTLAKKGEAEQTVETIRQNLKDAEALRAGTRARLADARALYEIQLLRASGPGEANERAALGLSNRLKTIERLEKELGDAQREAGRLEKALDRAISFRTVEQENASAAEKINRKYDAMIDKAALAADASKKAQDALAKEIGRINEAREAEIKRLRDTERERRKTQQDRGDATTFISPVSGGTVSGSFGQRRGNRNHAGIDIAVPVGTQVKAPAGGVIVEAGTLPGYGNVVYIDHGRGTISRLAHLSRIGVSKGDVVGQGDVVGLSGGARGAPGSGNSRGPHLHQEVRVGGRAVDPRKGPFPTDPGSLYEKAEQAAEAEERRRQAFENELASLLSSEIDARQALVTAAEEIARLEQQAIEVSRAKYDDNLKSLVEQGKLTDAEAAELRLINNERAKLRSELVKRREDERRFRMAEADRQRETEFASELRGTEQDLLRGQLDLARTQKERRDLERRLLDLQYQEERARLEYIIAYAERLRLQASTTESEQKEADAAAQIAALRLESLGQRQSQDQARSDRQTQEPLAGFFDSIPSDMDEINEALENVAAGGLATFTDALTDALVNFRSLKDVGLATLQAITAGLVRMAIQQIVLRTIGQASGATIAAASIAQGAAIAAAMAPAAAMVSLASYGANAGPAMAGIAATTALARGLSAVGFRDGGAVFGPGTATSDSIPARLSNGEFVIRKRAVDGLGLQALDFMNRTGQMPTFAEGGTMRAIRPMNAPAASPGSGNSSLSPAAVRELRGIVGDAAAAQAPVNLYPTLDPGAAMQAMLSDPGGQRAMFDFVSTNSGKFKAQLDR